MFIKDIDGKRSDDLRGDLFYGGAFSVGAIARDRSALKLFIEEPCLAACEYLYDCNIRTIDSSANRKNVNGHASIGIDYDSLSDENKKVYHSLVQEGILANEELEYNEYHTRATEFSIEIPVYENSTVEEVSDKFLKIAKRFQKQRLMYGYRSKQSIVEQIVDDLYNGKSSFSSVMDYEDYLNELIERKKILPNSSYAENKQPLTESLTNSEIKKKHFYKV